MRRNHRLRVEYIETLSNWTALNNALRAMRDETELKQLLNAAVKSKVSVMFLIRIHSRYNRFRAERERTQLLQGKGV